MTSKVIHHEDKYRCALGVHYDDQINLLKKALNYFSHMRFKTQSMTSYTKKPFQEGAELTINGIIKLHQTMKNDYNVPYLCTANTTQDYVERQIGIYRQMGGSCSNGPALTVLRHVAQDLRSTLLAVI